MPHHQQASPGIDPDPDGRPPCLPDPDQLAQVDQQQLTPREDDQLRPWLPASEQPTRTDWTWCTGSDEPPF